MAITCPCCELEDDLIIYPKLPIALRGAPKRGEPIITEQTDVTCLNCYWQGTLSDLRSDKKSNIVKTVKNRVKVVLG